MKTLSVLFNYMLATTVAMTSVVLAGEVRVATFGTRGTHNWGDITYHNTSIKEALLCRSNQDYRAVGIDDQDPVPIDDCEALLSHSTFPTGVWNITNLTATDDRWEILAEYGWATFFIAPVPATDSDSFIIGTEDMRGAIQHAVDNFDLGNGVINTTKGRLSGCPGLAGDLEWLVYKGQDQPIQLPPRA